MVVEAPPVDVRLHLNTTQGPRGEDEKEKEVEISKITLALQLALAN